jgi:hypothetical protein
MPVMAIMSKISPLSIPKQSLKNGNGGASRRHYHFIVTKGVAKRHLLFLKTLLCSAF